jgi:hypothetical protein
VQNTQKNPPWKWGWESALRVHLARGQLRFSRLEDTGTLRARSGTSCLCLGLRNTDLWRRGGGTCPGVCTKAQESYLDRARDRMGTHAAFHIPGRPGMVLGTVGLSPAQTRQWTSGREPRKIEGPESLNYVVFLRRDYEGRSLEF